MNAVDTNVLIYACDKSNLRHREIARDVLKQTHGGVIPYQVAVEFIAAARKLSSQGFTSQAAWSRLKNYLKIYRMALPTRAMLDRAKSLRLDHRWSYWDALLVAACLDAGVTRLYTEDMPGSAPPEGLEIINPFA